ncbi:hypothetical protein K449DRAFT_149747 [Hypoxylon sp. EC38]|nr:hypothetical protein K449DRAFT_149747 [Hypoxylon sp. EC38]
MVNWWLVKGLVSTSFAFETVAAGHAFAASLPRYVSSLSGLTQSGLGTSKILASMSCLMSYLMSCNVLRKLEGPL